WMSIASSKYSPSTLHYQLDAPKGKKFENTKILFKYRVESEEQRADLDQINKSLQNISRQISILQTKQVVVEEHSLGKFKEEDSLAVQSIGNVSNLMILILGVLVLLVYRPC